MTQEHDSRANWLTVEQAAIAYRLSKRTVRRRLTTGEIEAVKVSTVNGEAWRIKPPQLAPEQPTAPPRPDVAAGLDLIRIADVERLLAPVVAERDRLLVERDELRQQVANLGETRLTDAREQSAEIGRLRGLLEAAQQSTMVAPQPQPTQSKHRRRWFWQR